MNIAVILAAGSGKRMGMEIPKQFVEVNGKLVIEYSLATFQAHPDIDEIAVVTSETYLPLMNELRNSALYPKWKKVLQGGAERYQSSLAAIRAYGDNPDDILLIHDAARPLVSAAVITKVLETMQHANAAVVAVPASDTVLHSFDNKHIADIPPRKEMYYAQTPQAFRVKTIQRAFELGLQDACFNPTDDSGVMLRYLPEEPIVIVDGESKNRKITYQDDLLWLASQIQNS
jgi:2-C-methyl-D-erythritol 4-phosphate cytidylyltransferase